MKVCHPSENFTSLKTLILQLQLTLELSRTQEILSIYTNFLLLFAEYPSLFNFFTNNFISQAPERAGGNWYGYAGQNLVRNIDPTGLVYYDQDGVHSSNDATIPHKSTGQGQTPKVPDASDTTPTNKGWSEEETFQYSDDYGNLTDDPNSISGKNMGEDCSEFLTPAELFQYILALITDAGLMGKEYSDDYLCTNFGKDVINLLGENLNDYYPSDDLVKNNLDKLRQKDNSVFELGKNDKLKSGVYVFYKIYNNDFNGHTGILYVDSNGSQTVLHNGRNPNTQFEGVNEYYRPYNNFNNFFGIKEQKNNVYLKEIKKKR